jgi:hypothetical protein
MQEPYVSPAAVMATTGVRGVGRTLRLLAVGISDELRRLLGRVGLQLPPVYLRLVAPITDPKALALLPLQVRVAILCCCPAPDRHIAVAVAAKPACVPLCVCVCVCVLCGHACVVCTRVCVWAWLDVP